MTDEEPLPKQVLVLRADLKMRKGKMVAQGAHAAMKVFFDRIPDEVREKGWPEGFSRITIPIEINRHMFDWMFGIFTKVCCRVESEDELLALYEQAQGAGLPCCLITDAGKTEFHGVPTNTAVCIGPAMPEDIDPITRHLKLL